MHQIQTVKDIYYSVSGGVIVVSAGAFAPVVYCVSPLTTITSIYNFRLCKGLLL